MQLFLRRWAIRSWTRRRGAASSAKAEPLDISEFEPARIRNFSIIAHVDHGKSTLADRLLELTGTIQPGGDAQILDKLQVEKERGITVKAQTASMFHRDSEGRAWLLNLIDTPGHVDFHYEVRRSLRACDGALLVVDANQGVQAQTVANFWLAFELDLPLIPLINKIDLPGANPELVEEQMKEMFDFQPSDALRISAKTGTGVPAVIDRIIEVLPPPTASVDDSFKALIFDSWYTHFRGCIALVAVKGGRVARGDVVRAFHSGKEYSVVEVGVMQADLRPTTDLRAGQVGYVIANMKSPGEAEIGETLMAPGGGGDPLPGFERVQPMVFAGLFPLETAEYDRLRDSVEKLCLNDPSVSIERDSSPALGQGWRLGFLGILHMEVFGQRLEQEHDAEVILSAPSVPYRARLKDNPSIRKKHGGVSELLITDPGKFPEGGDVDAFLEPVVLGTIICPMDVVGAMEDLCRRRRGAPVDIRALHGNRACVRYRLPLAEIIVDFFDELKRLSSGYASFDYEDGGFVESDLALLSVKLNQRLVPEFAKVVPKTTARQEGWELLTRLKREIPRQVYDVDIRIQAGGKAVASAKIKATKKDFTQKLKGNFGDLTRLNKLIKHQKEGQARMKLISQVQIPKNAFVNILRK